MTTKFLAMLMLLCFSTSIAHARTWRTTDERKFSGDFQGLDGNQVVIRTTQGRVEKVSYLKLSKSDRTFVKSTLTSMAKQDEVQRLIQLETSGTSGAPAQSATPTESAPGQQPESADGKPGTDSPLSDARQVRIWTDVNGNQLQARFISSNALQVTLELVSGGQKNFPIAGFRSEDQQLIRQLADPAASEQPGVPGSSGGPGQPLGSPGFPGMPGGPGAPAPSFPGLPGNAPGSAGFPGAGLPGPGFPGGLPGGPSSGPGFPGSLSPGGSFPPGAGTPTLPQAPQTAGSPLGSPNPDSPAENSAASAPGMPPFGGGGGFGPPNQPGAGGFGPPGQPGAGFGPAGGPPAINPGDGIPSGPDGEPMGGFEYIYRCEDCGAEFTEADGVKEGDTCPKCPWYKRVRMRNVGRLIGFAACLAIGAISFIVRKIRGG
ncbi:MAG: FmdB family zinc ribbon protein [Planctomycetota bacterium]